MAADAKKLASPALNTLTITNRFSALNGLQEEEPHDDPPVLGVVHGDTTSEIKRKFAHG